MSEMIKNIDKIFTCLGLDISFSYDKNPCLHIKNSHLIQEKKEIKDLLSQIHTYDEYKKLQAAGYTRTLVSEYREWKAHNFLYRIGYKRERTGSTDIDQNEPMWRRIVYAVLSIF